MPHRLVRTIHQYRERRRNARKGCPACAARAQTDFFQMRSVPADVGMLYSTFEAARHAPVVDIELTYCHSCGLIRNSKFDPAQIAFRPGYDAALHHSPKVQSFLSDTADRLTQRFHLRRQRILEIGCGDGYFLRLLCERGENSGIGIDPTVPWAGTEALGSADVTWLQDYFRQEHCELDFDFVCCRAVLEDIPNPAHFLSMLRAGLGNRRIGLYFEVFDARQALERGEIWSIHYEQCNYFGWDSFRKLFERCGFQVIGGGSVFEGQQFLFVELISGPTPVVEEPSMQPEHRPALPSVLANFSQSYADQSAAWRQRLPSLRQADCRAVLWGAGGKGITFLNSFDTLAAIPYVVDINPNRQDRFVPRSGQRTVGPEFLREYRPTVVIISNPIYEPEIRRRVGDLGLNCEFLFV